MALDACGTENDDVGPQFPEKDREEMCWFRMKLKNAILKPVKSGHNSIQTLAAFFRNLHPSIIKFSPCACTCPE